MSPSPTRVVLIDDDDLLRRGLSLLLGADERIEIVAEAADGVAGLEAIQRFTPDVVVVDLRMPRLDGVSVVRRLEGRVPALVLTAFDTDEFVHAALDAGAVGFLLKSSAPDVLVEAVLAAAEGRSTLSPGVLSRALAPKRPQVLDTLSPREKEVALLISQGLSNPEIAARLFVSLSTVKTHVARIMDKLGVESRVQIALEINR